MKNKNRNIIIFSALALLISSCTKQESETKVKDMNIKLSWGMITNMLEGESNCRAAFTIQNKSSQTIGNSGWAIYYSQIPRKIMNQPNAKAIIKPKNNHIKDFIASLWALQTLNNPSTCSSSSSSLFMV